MTPVAPIAPVPRVVPVTTEEPIENPFSKVSRFLIERNYRQIGCDSWNRPKFWRLCGKLQRTEIEMAALLRLTHAELRHRLKGTFSKQDGLILSLLDREIDSINSGSPPTPGMFYMAELKSAK